METAAGLLELKPGFEEFVHDWCATTTRRCDEALETLRAEGVAVESWFQVDIEGQPYLLGYLRAGSIKRVWKAARQSSLEIDA
jgi:hypothetical protein